MSRFQFLLLCLFQHKLKAFEDGYFKRTFCYLNAIHLFNHVKDYLLVSKNMSSLNTYIAKCKLFQEKGEKLFCLILSIR